MKTYSVEKVEEMLGDVVTERFNKAEAQQMSEGYIKLERRFATIPLLGIDVPFYSGQALYRSVYVSVMFSCLMLRSCRSFSKDSRCQTQF
jgi:hypothetical protein